MLIFMGFPMKSKTDSGNTEYPLFQPTKRVVIDDYNNLLKLYFDVNEVLIPSSVPQTPPTIGDYNRVFILDRLRQHYNTKLKMMQIDFSEPRCSVGTGIIPILNNDFTIVQFRPAEYLSYPGKLAFSGGFLETRLLPLQNARKEFCEETIIYDFKNKILYTADFCSEKTVEEHIKVLKTHEYEVNDVEKFKVTFLKFDNMTKIIAENNNQREVSHGYVLRRPMSSNIEIYYIAKIHHEFDFNNITTLAFELGGELSFISKIRDLMLARESYFSTSSNYVLKKFIELGLFL